jgi:glyoxylase-like metal-dependent hydrolase (beta-lactamase superfamily II)
VLAVALVIGVSGCFAAGFTPKEGDLYLKEIGGVKFHVYTSPIPMGASASVVIETKNAVILQDTQQNKAQNEELKALIASMGKPLSRIYVSHDHSHHWAGLEMFGNVPVYANQDTVNSIKQKGADMLKDLRGQFGEAAIPYAKVVVPGRVVDPGKEEVVDGVRFVFRSPAPELTGPVLIMEFPDQRVLITHHLAYVGVHVPMPPVGPRLAKLNEMKEKEYAWVIGGHGIPVTGPEYFSKTIDYFTTLGKVIKSPDVKTAKERMVEAYKNYGGVFLLDLLLPAFYRK